MSGESPYIRRGLPRPEPDAPTAKDVVEEWVGWLTRVRESIEVMKRRPREAAFELLVLWRGLARFRSELLEEVGGVGGWRWLEDLVASEKRVLAAAAQKGKYFDADQWIEAASEFECSYESDTATNPLQCAETAMGLLKSLDEAELLCCALQRLGVEARRFFQSVEEAAVWCSRKPEVFLAAGMYVRAIGEAIRPDLYEVDPTLAVSAEKYVYILDEMEEAAAMLCLERMEPWSADVVKALPRLGDKQVESSLRDWLARVAAAADHIRRALVARPPLPRFVPVLAAAAEVVVREGIRLDWRAQEGEWEAMMRLPDESEAADDREVILWISRPPAEAAAVALCGLVRRIERKEGIGEVRFTMKEMREGWERSDLPTLVLLGADLSIISAGVPLTLKD